MLDRPGWKTTEFWLSLVVIVLGATIASGLIPDGTVWSKIAGIVMSTLTAMGYTAARAKTKVGLAELEEEG